ncbi:MAG: hypothetical protein C5B58_04200 [Acidobacteria bacterium]|nr:MAG: hypothetical protein C5B58_04200 [Acidobacteriota bacterium]
MRRFGANVKNFGCFILGCMLVLPSICAGQNQDWREITQQERDIKEVPGDPGAPAIQLFYEDYRDDDSRFQFTYHRIKVLTEAGKKYADVEIPLNPLLHFIDVRARTIHPDGSITEFKGKPFEKLLAKTRDVKFVAETFTMPDVTVGSIIEYKYRYTWDRIVFDTSWSIQHDLYTVKEHFWLRGYSKLLKTKHYMTGEGTNLSYVVSGAMPATPNRVGDAVELTLENVPAFKGEDYAPPAEDLKPTVRFFYGGNETLSPDAFWKEYGRTWFSESERFIGNRDSVRSAASEAMGAETDPEKRLKRLYERAQAVRNLSFERRRNKQEDKKEDLKPNENSGDVLARSYGTHNDITRLFVALARAGGFDARIVRVPNRRAYFFKASYLVASQLSSEIALVNLNGRELYLDPGTEFCPFGLVRWLHTGDKALKLDGAGGTFVMAPPAQAEATRIFRIGRLSLEDDGSAKGTLQVEFTGNAALEHRLSALDEDDAGRRKSMEDEAKGWLPEGAAAELDSAENWESTDEPLRVRFKVQIPSFASVAGKRILIPASMFKTTQRKQAFQHQQRKYPVYFPYAYQEMDNMIVDVPEGRTAEAVPGAQDANLSFTRFATSRSFSKNQFVSKRALIINGIFFPITDYPQLKSFFQKVQAADDEQLVLQASAVTAGK